MAATADVTCLGCGEQFTVEEHGASHALGDGPPKQMHTCPSCGDEVAVRLSKFK